MMSRFLRTSLVVTFALLISAALAMSAGASGATWRGYPLLLWLVVLSFAIQWLMFLPSYLLQTDRVYDLTGSLTFLALVGLTFRHVGQDDPRALLLTGLIAVWALRLGLFLFARILRSGKDRRFDVIKTSASRFFVTWSLQGMWVFITLLAALIAISGGRDEPLGWIELGGIALWLIGFAIEVIADRQKAAFLAVQGNHWRYIDVGLWRYSRHPNYFGEIVLWTGIAMIAAPVFEGWQWLGLLSPVFVFLLLTKISGIPLLEKHADAKWGDQVDYQNYKRNTPVLVPRLTPGC